MGFIQSVSDCVTFKLRRCHRSETPDILRTTSRDLIDDKSDLTTTTTLLPLDSIRLEDLSVTRVPWSSLDQGSNLSNAQSTTELIKSNCDHKSQSSLATTTSDQSMDDSGLAKMTEAFGPATTKIDGFVSVGQTTQYCFVSKQTTVSPLLCV